MNNYYGIEVEAAFRRNEWEKAIAADARAAQLPTGNWRKHWPHLSFASLRSLTALRLPFSAPLVPRRRSVIC